MGNFLGRSMLLLAVVVAVTAKPALADAITDWDVKICKIVDGGSLGPPPVGGRAIAISQTAVYEAVNAITKKYPDDELAITAEPGASVDAAIAAAHHAVLLKLLPERLAPVIEDTYKTSLAALPDSAAKTNGIRAGEAAAAKVLAFRANDGFTMTESYRPPTTAGNYIPTTIPVMSQAPLRTPWLMRSADQFRPGPPPELDSEIYARDFNEIKTLGAKTNSTRTPEQTAIARFWEATVQDMYHAFVREVADQPGREITQNARLFAAVTQAVDDAYIAVFDAKYHYNFWRPVTAIRNADIDGNPKTDRDASWLPFIDTPMHPEYPCAHCIIAATVGTVLKAEIGKGPSPTLTAYSPTADVSRSWATVDAMIKEVGNGRVYDGVHWRNSTEIGESMGRKIGGLAVTKFRL